MPIQEELRSELGGEAGRGGGRLTCSWAPGARLASLSLSSLVLCSTSTWSEAQYCIRGNGEVKEVWKGRERKHARVTRDGK